LQNTSGSNSGVDESGRICGLGLCCDELSAGCSGVAKILQRAIGRANWLLREEMSRLPRGIFEDAPRTSRILGRDHQRLKGT